MTILVANFVTDDGSFSRWGCVVCCALCVGWNGWAGRAAPRVDSCVVGYLNTILGIYWVCI